MSEDCLYLKIVRPGHLSRGKSLPVMVEIHGGGFVGEALTDHGSNLVRRGVIYVYPSYRLGILGFLAEKALGKHSGDYGLQDQQAALRWVKQNISAFGGDPDNITVFGESAGGASVCALATSPTARGLFEKGISLSGFYNYNTNNVWPRATASRRTTPRPRPSASAHVLPRKSVAGLFPTLLPASGGCPRASWHLQRERICCRDAAARSAP